MENLNAAIPLANSSNILSQQEFQNMLTSWFEEKGLVADLRSYLRFKMVNVLKNTTVGRNIHTKMPQQNSFAKQAINLIVAEFLMQNNHHYSLSVFNAETALNNVLPEYQIFDVSKAPFRLDSENISNILELIGIPKTSEFCKDLLKLYFESCENSILSCLVKLLCKLVDETTKPRINEENVKVDLANETIFSKQVGNILMQSLNSSENIVTTVKHIDSLHNSEVKNIEDKYNKIVRVLRGEVVNHERKTKELTKKKIAVENTLMKVTRDYNALKVKLKQVTKEKLLKESQEKLSKECLMQQNKEMEQKIVKLVAPSESVQQQSTPIICSGQHCQEKCQENSKTLKTLQVENQELHRKSEEQLEELATLSRKYNDVLQDFMGYQNKICLLNSKMNDESKKPVANISSGEYQGNTEGSLQHQLDVSVSSESVTEEILREARQRLRALEEESKNIEENYKEIQRGLSYIKL